MDMRIRRVVVLGHSGFIGTALLRRLRATRLGIDIVGLAREDLDLSTPEGAALATPHFDKHTAVVLCSGIKRQLGDSPDTFLKNVAIVANVAKILADHPVARVVYLSSAAVYGEDIENLAITEATPLNARSYYGLAKQTGEWILARVAAASPEMTLGLVRPATVYGPGDLGTAYGPSGFLDAALSGRPITVWGDGSELREFIYIDDVAAILADYVFMDHDGPLNLVSGTSYSCCDVLDVVRVASGAVLEVNSRPRTKDKVDHRFDNTAFRRLFPSLRFTSIAEGTARMHAAQRLRDDRGAARFPHTPCLRPDVCGPMSERTGYLVIGGDSLVGGGTVAALGRRGARVLATTRRRATIDAGRVHLDFEDPATFRAPPGIGYAFLIAAAANYERCERDPQARVINVELIPRLVVSLLEQGVFVAFVSTNSVFGGERPWPHEDDPHAPGIAYARQKSEGEAAIRAAAERHGATERLAIVRLTKILNASVSPLPAWLAAWDRGEAVEPFEDLIFAPISVRFVGEALATIGASRAAGNLHVSGAENVSYVAFAHALARRLGVDPALIRPTTAVAKGVHIPFKPRYSGLGMTRTAPLTGLAPQPLDRLVDDLATELGR
jgi:nucleoside-diphosphate-sugar epimerase